MTCPQCNGAKHLTAFARRVSGTAYYIELDCDLCQSTGAISDEQLNWVLEGEKLRQARINREETLREFAKRTGIDVGAVSKAERGCINPDIIKQ